MSQQTFLDRLLYRMTGRSVFPPPDNTVELAKAVATDLVVLLQEGGRTLADNFELEAANLHLAEGMDYIWWLLVEAPEHWPPLPPKDKASLKLGLEIMQSTAAIPNYTAFAGIGLLDPEEEERIDQLFPRLARRLQTKFAAGLHRQYVAILGKHAKHLTFSTADLADFHAGINKEILLQTYFQGYVLDYPEWFPEGHLLRRILTELFFIQK